MSWSQSETAVLDAVLEFERDTARVHVALAVTLPHLRLPDPQRSIGYYDVGLATPHTFTLQGHADQELLFHASAATPPVVKTKFEPSRHFMATWVDPSQELVEATRMLIDSAEPALGVDECLTMSVLALEGLLLPNVTQAVQRTFATRLANLLGTDDTSRKAIDRLARRLYDTRSRVVHGEAQAASSSEAGLTARAPSWTSHCPGVYGRTRRPSTGAVAGIAGRRRVSARPAAGRDDRRSRAALAGCAAAEGRAVGPAGQRRAGCHSRPGEASRDDRPSHQAGDAADR
jgi:hypothetical protein